MLPLCSAGNSTFLFPVSSLLQKSYIAIAWTFVLNQQQWHVFIYTKSLLRSTVKAILSFQESLTYCLWKDNFALKISYNIQFSLPNPGSLNKLVIFTISSGKKVSYSVLGDLDITHAVSGVTVSLLEARLHDLIVRAVIIIQCGACLWGVPLLKGLNCAAHSPSCQL